MISRILNHFKPRSITKEALAPQIDAYLTSQFIAKAITSGAPFLASRLGFTEARCLSQPEGIENPSDFVMDLIWRYSGFSLLRESNSGNLAPFIWRPYPKLIYLASSVILPKRNWLMSMPGMW